MRPATPQEIATPAPAPTDEAWLREDPPAPEGLRAMDDLDRWWERHITATYLRWVEKYPHLFPTHGDTDPPGRSGTTGRIATAGRGETFPQYPSHLHLPPRPATPAPAEASR